MLLLARPPCALAALAFFLFGAGPILDHRHHHAAPGGHANAMLGRVSAVILRVSAVILTATFGARPVGALIARPGRAGRHRRLPVGPALASRCNSP